MSSSAQPSHEIDLDVTKLVLDVVDRKLRYLSTRIDASLTGGTIERTIDGASTLTLQVHDPKHVLLRSGLFDQQVQLRLDRLFWRLCQISKQGDDLTLTFEDREVALLRRHSAPKKAKRGNMTRAEFALSLVREVREGGGIPFVCPELHVRAPIQSSKMEKTTRERSYNREQGLAPNRLLTVKGATADAGQLRNAQKVLDVANSFNADDRVKKALVEAVIVESQIRNLSGGDRDSRGILQVRDQTARGMSPPINNRDISQCCAAFLTRGFYKYGGALEIARKNPKMSAGQIAQHVQGSAYGSRYDQHQHEAQAFLDQYEGGVTTTTTRTTKTVLVPYQYRRGGADGTRENSWECLQRLAKEVEWRCFMSAGSLYFISEDALLRSKPRLVVREFTPGIVDIDFDLDTGKPVATATLTARAARWAVPPGAVVQIEDYGPATGRWLVADISRGVFDADARIGLKRVTHALKEPAAETRQRTFTRRSAGAAATSAAVERVYRKAKQISSKRFPYVWGGGHARAGTPSGSPPGYDCSGSVIAALAAGGLGYQPGGSTDVSGTMAREWGEPGPGQEMTVYANDSHVFVVFTFGFGSGRKAEFYTTGDWGSGWGGAGFKPNPHPTTNFRARHWPGT